MKNLIISVICLLILMIPWGIYDRFSDASTDRYKDILTNRIIPAAESGNWQQAEEDFNFIAKDWDRFRKISAYFIDTDSIDEVNARISRVYCYIRQQDTVNAVTEATDLNHRLDYLHENETPSIENIL